MLNLEKVLHIEDNADLRHLVRRYFGGEWTRIDEAENIKDAIRLIESTGNNYQLIILDLGLKGKTAPATIHESVAMVRLIRACTIAPFVIYTGAGPDVIQALEAQKVELGIYGIIAKGTFSLDRVRAIIENAVRTWREERINETIGTLTAQIDSITAHRRQVLRELGA
jgi:DNA-binding NtrC family response regulator